MTWVRTVTASGTVAILAMLLLAAMAASAAAADRTGRDRANPPGHARFEGRHIDLSTGWGDARACVVWTSDGDTDCFRTDAEASEAAATRDRGTAPTSTAAWGFAGQASSYRVGSCGASLRDAGWASHPGPTGAGTSAASMAPGWNDRVRYLRIS